MFGIRSGSDNTSSVRIRHYRGSFGRRSSRIGSIEVGRKGLWPFFGLCPPMCGKALPFPYYGFFLIPRFLFLRALPADLRKGSAFLARPLKNSPRVGSAAEPTRGGNLRASLTSEGKCCPAAMPGMEPSRRSPLRRRMVSGCRRNSCPGSNWHTNTCSPRLQKH